MSDPIVDRIDALVRKRRSFVASAADAPPPAAAARDGDDDDLPVLTEIVEIDEAPPEAPAVAATPPLQPLLDALANDLAHAIEDRLSFDMPEILEHALANLHADLRQGIVASVDAASRDFLARRQQLRLPFPDDRPEPSV